MSKPICSHPIDDSYVFEVYDIGDNVLNVVVSNEEDPEPMMEFELDFDGVEFLLSLSNSVFDHASKKDTNLSATMNITKDYDYNAEVGISYDKKKDEVYISFHRDDEEYSDRKVMTISKEAWLSFLNNMEIVLDVAEAKSDVATLKSNNMK